MKGKTGTISIRNKVLRILFFLFVASVFGIFNKFSKDYIYEVPFQLKYNIPPNRFLANSPPKTMSVEINGTGWYLFFENLDNSGRVIEINCTDDLNQTFTKGNLLDSVNSYLAKYRLGILNISPSEIEVELSPAAKKEIKIIQPIRASYFASYGLVEPMQLSDSMVTVFGSKETLEEINDLVLDTLIFENLKENTSITIHLPDFPDHHISFDKKYIQLNILVDQFTQKTFTLPFSLKNFPSQRNFEFIPKEVTMTVDIPLQKYNSITEKNFELQLNYSDLQRTSERKLIPLTITKSNVAPNYINIRPQFIEIIEIQK